MGVEFERDDYRFLAELGLAAENLGCYGGGVWRANGPTVTSINPSDNKVRWLRFGLCIAVFAFCVDMKECRSLVW
jgi:hypothetical protein